MTRLSILFLIPLSISLFAIVVVNSFSIVVNPRTSTITVSSSSSSSSSFNVATIRSFKQKKSLLFAGDEKSSSSSSSSSSDSVAAVDDNNDDDDDVFEKVELLGKGAAKVKRGKRKGSSSSSSTAASTKVSLTPEEIFYEGPPAITETIVPTISILTVVGIIPAAAAWARQAWVRYKITTRRIRVQSGFNGNEMAEIVYPDIIEIRTVKRLFGDGDMVVFLRDGAKFEMRNIPNFDDTIEFILKQVNTDVAATYRLKGDVGKKTS